MDSVRRMERVRRHLAWLVDGIGARPPGSPANRRANVYVREALERAGLAVHGYEFSTRWWEPGPATLVVDEIEVDVTANPYSPPARVSGPVVRLGADGPHLPAGAAGAIVVLDAALTPEPLMPKAFPFANPTDHRALIGRLEALQPAAVVAISDTVPIFEDPDLPFPSVTVPSEVAARLASGHQATLHIGGLVHQATGETIAGRTQPSGRRVMVSAHIDSKVTTPGAFDNASGVAAVLAWVEGGLPAGVPVEVVFFNGEDHFDACGEQAWLAGTDLAQISANVNLDGVGAAGRGTSVTTLGAGPRLAKSVDGFVEGRTGWELTNPWIESDHAIFAMQGIPAIAVTSVGAHQLAVDIAHTPRDTLDMVDPAAVANVAAALDSLVALAWAESGG